MTANRVSWMECLLVGVFVFGIAGTGGVLLMLDGLVRFVRSGESVWDGLDPTVVGFAVMAASLSGVVAWRVIVATKDSPPRRGTLAGLFVGIVAHPLCWFLVFGYQIARDPSLRSQSLQDVVFNLTFMTLWATTSSFGILGWISSPLGAMLGYLMKRINRRRGIVQTASVE
jgi:hypothetical protein